MKKPILKPFPNPPTLEDCMALPAAKDLPELVVKHFWSHWQSKGWRRNQERITDLNTLLLDWVKSVKSVPNVCSIHGPMAMGKIFCPKCFEEGLLGYLTRPRPLWERGVLKVAWFAGFISPFIRRGWTLFWRMLAHIRFWRLLVVLATGNLIYHALKQDGMITATVALIVIACVGRAWMSNHWKNPDPA